MYILHLALKIPPWQAYQSWVRSTKLWMDDGRCGHWSTIIVDGGAQCWPHLMWPEMVDDHVCYKRNAFICTNNWTSCDDSRHGQVLGVQLYVLYSALLFGREVASRGPSASVDILVITEFYSHANACRQQNFPLANSPDTPDVSS